MEPKSTNGKMKGRISAVAARLLGELGYDGTTYRMIADELGIAKSVITYHFKSKPLMVSGIFEGYGAELREYVRANLKCSFNYYLFHCIVHICLYRAAMATDAVREVFFHKEIFGLWSGGKLGLVESCFRDIADDFKKELTGEDIHAIAVMNQGAKQSLYQEFLQDPGALPVDRFCYHCTYLLGVLSRLDESTIQKNIERAYDFVETHAVPKLDMLS